MFYCQSIQAQHCKWDGSLIMVFEIKSQPEDTVSINNLKVTVSDSMGNPFMISYNFNGEKKRQPLFVFQNRDDHGCKVKGIPNLFDVRCFWFAKNNYVIIASQYEFEKGNMIITIEDTDGEENGGLFAKYSFTPNPHYAFELCSRFSKWENGKKSGFVEGFKPYEIILKKLK